MKAQLFIAASFVTLFSTSGFAAISGAAPANACQMKALVAVTQELKSALGVTDAVVGNIRQTKWVVTFDINSDQAVSATNPAGQIDALVGIKNVTADDCETTGASVNEYSTNG